MIDITVADLRNKSEVLRGDEVLHIKDGRKREGLGYYVPEKYESYVKEAIAKVETEKKRALLARVAAVQALDPIGDGAVGDGLEKG